MSKMTFKERIRRSFSRHNEYRIAVNKNDKFIIQRYGDPYWNSMYRWFKIELDESIIDKVVAESRKHDLSLDEDGGLLFNYELLTFMNDAINKFNEQVVQKKQNRFIQTYQNQ